MPNSTLPSPEGFNYIVDGEKAQLFLIRSADGACTGAITNFGARIVSLVVPDQAGIETDVVLGYSSLEDYRREPEEYMGAIVGRCANRIAAGLFVLDGHTYALPTNNNHNTLHGGIRGLHARMWAVLKAADDMLVLTYRSPDGEEGFPGNADIEVIYEWTEQGSFRITYHAVSDRSTLMNLSNHAYFNLSGEGAETILDHELSINADAITPVDDTLIPTGKLNAVAGSPFDFTSSRRIGDQIDMDHPQIGRGKGYDHNYVLNAEGPALTLRSPLSGISMSIFTDRPGMQVYSGNFLDGSRKGKSGRPYGYRSALALEPQGFPDAIHHPQFPSVVLRPGEVYHTTTEYRFSA